jgi:hypothetical protein
MQNIEEHRRNEKECMFMFSVELKPVESNQICVFHLLKL